MTILQATYILELDKPYTTDGIKKAYREQAKLWHPDNFRVYEQQIEAGRRFIQIKEAYDYLRVLDIADLNNYNPNIEDGILYRNRASEYSIAHKHKIFSTPLFKEADNILSLFYLFAKWKWFGLPGIFSKAYNAANEYIRPNKQGLGPTLARFALFILIILMGAILAAITVPLLAFIALLFAPLMWLYIKSVQWLTTLFKKVLGYLPAPNCGFLSGELLYLGLRSLMPVILLVAGIVYIPFRQMPAAYLLLFSGYIAFTIFITISVLYEWVSFYRVQYLRSKIKNS
ncbi:MAG: J domain-containing protein [Sphingobacteriales bacterium JAD_PAG50586_3]|nr:MAG: J domain-containing protein [Sphingobacteriales bacterium JAD_PAG50586_3]